jgi:hypothetical protein
MKPPNLVVTNKIGEQSTWKCPACSEPFDLSGYHGTTKEKYDAMFVAYRKHFTNRHSHEDASQAAARITRQITKQS